MSTVPKVVAEWMVLHLPNRDDTTANCLEKAGGLGVLTVKELKSLTDTLYSMVAVLEEVSIWEWRLPSSAKKDRRINFLRRGLFRNDICTIANDRLLRDMRAEISTSTAKATTTSTAKPSTPVASSPSAATRVPSSRERSAASSTDSRKRPNHRISSQQYQHEELRRRQQQQQQQLNRFSPQDAVAFFDAYHTASQFNPARYRPAQPQHGYNPLTGMQVSAALLGIGGMNRTNGQYNNHHESSNEEDSGAAGAATAGGGASSAFAAATDPQGTPQNSTEAILLQQLLQMGFLKQEILDGIRQCRSGTAAIPSADEVMLHLVTQREEAEEARKEDEVRLRSEDQKQEESKRREQNQTESLSKATTGEDLSALFPESWVLKAMSADNLSVSQILRNSDSRTDFLEFLKLEEKSRKWYGWILPSDYFRTVGKQLMGAVVDNSNKNSNKNNKPIPSWVTFLSNEREKLRCGLYELKEQLNGQPKIFLDQRCPKEKNGGAAEIVIIDDDDDDD